MNRAAFALFCLVVTSCASTIEHYPRRSCLFFSDRRWATGQIIEKADDGKRLFKFDDRSQGDNGYRWVSEDDNVTLRPCTQVDPLSAASDGSMHRQPPEPPR